MDLGDVASSVGPQLAGNLGLRELLSARTCCGCLASAVRGPLALGLMEVVSGRTTVLRVGALRLLASLVDGSRGDRQVAALAAQCLDDTRTDVRHAAVSALVGAAEGLQGGYAETAVRVLAPALSDCDDHVCMAASKALPKLVPRGDAVAIAAVMPHLNSALPRVRRLALCVLGEIGAKGNLKLIRDVSKLVVTDAHWHVRVAAARVLPSLVERGNNLAAGALEAALKDSEPAVQKVAAGALAHVSALPSMPFLAIKAREWRSPRRKPRSKRQLSLPAADTPGTKNAKNSSAAGIKKR
eukprot:TRINITY_DN57466_c0_g1_i1.p1 TRINITY_DN57466_c0_g1~~TRINITY_DN57466_c0_g1_i1.p1  ORF type:complete len:307 (+),score=58.12 TRINITY_DN57466_c0_g1_i1:30-923(+)